MYGLTKTLQDRQLADSRQKVEGRNTTSAITPTADSTSSAHQTEYNVNTDSDFKIGTGIIQDTVPFDYCYRVITDMFGMPIVCTTLQGMGGVCQAASLGAYTVGTHVLVAYSKIAMHGIILGTYEKPKGVEDHCIKTTLSDVCRTVEENTYKGVTLNDSDNNLCGLLDGSLYKLEEHTDVPEYGASFMTGMKLFIDPYLALLGLNDYTGITIFESDSLLRISGINYQLRSSGKEVEYLNDEGEYIEYEGTALHPWEQFGYYSKPKEDVMEPKEETEWHTEGSTINCYMPVVDNLQPFHRHIRFGGWLGQGDLVQIAAPYTDKDFIKFGDKDPVSCVSRIHNSLDGTVSIRTTKGISITKDGVMPAAMRVQRPDEINFGVGDNKQNYQQTDLIPPKDIKITARVNQCMQEMLGILDYSGYQKNWKDIFQLAYHSRDYHIAEESALKNKSIQSPDYSKLKSNFVLDNDNKYKLDIDYNRKDVEYNGVEAGIHILPSGGIVIYDGAGSEIRMAGGNITISCAGDINIKPGRYAHVWSGKDTIIKANKAIDISSTTESVRVKAEKNLELLGANDKADNHGVIIESKSSAKSYKFTDLGDNIVTNGIVLKAEKSPVALLGDVAYIRSGVGSSNGSGIYIDSGKGAGNIYTISKQFCEYIEDVHTINFTDMTSATVDVTTFFSKARNGINGPLVVTDNLFVDGQIQSARNMITCEAIIAFDNIDKLVRELSPNGKDNILKNIEDNVKEPEERKPAAYTNELMTSVQTNIYNPLGIGSDIVETGLGFSFRPTDQLQLPGNYYVYEDLWQHISNASGKSTNKWGEKPVISYAGESYPFPGKDMFMIPSYITQETVIADFKNNRYIDRKVKEGATAPAEGKYAEPQYGAQHIVSLQTYPII